MEISLENIQFFYSPPPKPPPSITSSPGTKFIQAPHSQLSLQCSLPPKPPTPATTSLLPHILPPRPNAPAVQALPNIGTHTVPHYVTVPVREQDFCQRFALPNIFDVELAKLTAPGKSLPTPSDAGRDATYSLPEENHSSGAEGLTSPAVIGGSISWGPARGVAESRLPPNFLPGTTMHSTRG
jgi:hypothetical protein